MSLTQEPFIATKRQTELTWGGGFWCKLCGHKFVEGDTVRWIYANSTPDMGTGNFFICGNCNNCHGGSLPSILDRAKADYANAKTLAKRWGIYGPDWQR